MRESSFQKGFGATTGVIAAIVIMGILIPMLACGSCMVAGRSSQIARLKAEEVERMKMKEAKESGQESRAAQEESQEEAQEEAQEDLEPERPKIIIIDAAFKLKANRYMLEVPYKVVIENHTGISVLKNIQVEFLDVDGLPVITDLVFRKELLPGLNTVTGKALGTPGQEREIKSIQVTEL